MRHNRHSNISIFIPHQGCPNACSFCNQRTITGQGEKTVEEIKNQLEEAMQELKNDRAQTEIAFFGGSFTAIEKSYMLSLLQLGSEFVLRYGLHGIRISTRPDCIDTATLTLLKRYNVTAIELGAQSMSDEILYLNRRGHTADDVVKSSKMIKEYGFELGLQMMVGLYGDSEKTVRDTAKRIIGIAPDTIRIYPTVVLKDTHLAEILKSGEYKTFSLESAVTICSELLSKFLEYDIRVIKLGLHSSTDVLEGMVGGIYHPAFRELCESRLYLKSACEAIEKYIAQNGNVERLCLSVNEREISKLVGQKRENIKLLEKSGIRIKVCGSAKLERYKIGVKCF